MSGRYNKRDKPVCFWKELKKILHLVIPVVLCFATVYYPQNYAQNFGIIVSVAGESDRHCSHYTTLETLRKQQIPFLQNEWQDFLCFAIVGIPLLKAVWKKNITFPTVFSKNSMWLWSTSFNMRSLYWYHESWRMIMI